MNAKPVAADSLHARLPARTANGIFSSEHAQLLAAAI
jgi:hypothetical protein